MHWGKFLNAVKFLLRGRDDAEAALAHIQESRQHWNRLACQAEGALAYRVSLGPADGLTGRSELSDAALAWSWFYGDVVHADADRRSSAAVGIVAQAAWLTYAGLALVERLQEDGLLDLDPSVFQEEVVVTGTEVTQPAVAWVGQPGGEPPAPGVSPDDLGWARLGVDPHDLGGYA